MHYRIKHLDERTITTLAKGRDSWAMICDTIAAEFDCDPDEVGCEEEFDDKGEWTGDELITVNREVVARLTHEFGWRAGL